MSLLQSLSLNQKLNEARDYFHQSQFEDSKLAYQKILNDYPETALRYDIYYNLALCCIALDDPKTAQVMLEKTLNLKPDHMNALNNLGAVLLKLEKFNEALQCFSAATHIDGSHLEARNNLAACLLQMGKANDALLHFKILLEKTPHDPHLQYSYAVALLDAGLYTQAIQCFEKLLEKEPDNLKIQSNLGISYLKAGEVNKARTLFKIIIDANPNQPEINFLYQALSQENVPSKPPLQYVQRLFDQYADYFEKHAIETLHYHAPERLLEFFLKHSPLQKEKWTICDLGCGTGLSGLPFQKLASFMVGIDISPKMLRFAEQKKIYDELIEADIHDYLKKSAKKFDLILSIDTLNYLGDLSDLFTQVFNALAPSGAFLFSVEKGEDADWSLKSHARYTHSKAYLETLAKIHGFKLSQIQNIILREQNHEPVHGFMCLLMKGTNQC